MSVITHAQCVSLCLLQLVACIDKAIYVNASSRNGRSLHYLNFSQDFMGSYNLQDFGTVPCEILQNPVRSYGEGKWHVQCTSI